MALSRSGHDTVLTRLRRVLPREVVFGACGEETNGKCRGHSSENGGCRDQYDFSRIHRRVNRVNRRRFFCCVNCYVNIGMLSSSVENRQKRREKVAGKSFTHHFLKKEN